MTYISAKDFGLEVARGNVTGMSSVNKFGRSTNVDLNTDTDIWDKSDQPVWVAPTASRIHQIVSDDAQDDAAGGGARTIQVYGLTGWGNPEQAETLTLAGTSAVFTSNSYTIIHRMLVLTKGSTSANVGTITATAETDSSVTAQINPNEGQTQMAIYGVPSTRTAYMPSYYSSYNRAGAGGTIIGVDITLAVNPEPDSELTNFIVKHTQALVSSGDTYFSHRFDPPLKITGPAIIKIIASATANDQDISAGFDLILIDN